MGKTLHKQIKDRSIKLFSSEKKQEAGRLTSFSRKKFVQAIKFGSDPSIS